MRREAHHEQDHGPIFGAVSGTEAAVACIICDGPIPPGTRGARHTCGSPECRSAYARWCVSHSASVRRARIEAIRGERECSDCGETFPLDAEHFPLIGNRNRQASFRRQCWPCWKTRNSAHKRRQWERTKADPERHARHLESERIRHALKRERQTGEFPNRAIRTATNAHREDVGAGAKLLHLGPIAAWLDVVIARELPDFGRKGGDNDRFDRGRTLVDLAEQFGCSPRRLWSIMHRAQDNVAFETVDKFVTRYPGVVCGDDMAVGIEARCRAMPGNGERLLRYMDAADDIAHLCDRAVWRAADLYPEMAS